jgi:hypothetical protein
MKKWVGYLIGLLLLWCAFWWGHALGMRDMAFTAADDVRTLEKLEASLKKRCQPTSPPETEMALSLTREQQLEMFEAVATTTAGQIALAPVTAPYMRLQLSRIRQENVKHAKP